VRAAATRRVRELEERARAAREALSSLEARSIALRERIREDSDAFAALIPQMMHARDVQRLAERAVAIAREPQR
jgi:hypothetical protein